MVGGWVGGLVSSSSGSNGWFVPYGQESSKKYLIFTSVALFLLIIFFHNLELFQYYILLCVLRYFLLILALDHNRAVTRYYCM